MLKYINDLLLVQIDMVKNKDKYINHLIMFRDKEIMINKIGEFDKLQHNW